MSNIVSVTEYEYSSCRVPLEFDEFRIAAVSDLHCNEIGKDNRSLIECIRKLEPDIIVCAGDMITDYSKNMDVALELLYRLSREFDIYYSYGNHELKLGINRRTHARYIRYRDALRSLGINFLNNRSLYITRKNERIRITGLNIKMSYYQKIYRHQEIMPDDYINSLIGRAKEDDFNILLAHNPEYFREYAKWNADVVISGHVHGGMVVLPYIGGVISPSFRLFPHYDFGEYTMGNSKMYLSRGLGSHTIPVRIFNPPEIMSITLRRSSNGNTGKA